MSDKSQGAIGKPYKEQALRATIFQNLKSRKEN
jgi:hypothetical protein